MFHIQQFSDGSAFQRKAFPEYLKGQYWKCEDACCSAFGHLVEPEAQATLNHALFFALDKYQHKMHFKCFMGCYIEFC